MTGTDIRPRKVLAVMDGTDAQSAPHNAAALADRHGATLDVLACVDPPRDINLLARVSGRSPAQLIDTLRARTRDDMQTRLDTHVPDRAAHVTVAVGKTFVEIIRHVIDEGCDFVVKAAEPDGGMHRLLYASTDQHLLRKCPCPVWLQTPDATHVPRRVIAAVDVDTEDADEPDTLAGLNQRVIDAARAVAAPTGAELIVLHAWDAVGEGLIWAFGGDRDARASADAYVNAILEARHRALDRLVGAIAPTPAGGAAPRVTSRLARGVPEEVIKDEARALRADLVVMGTVARTGLGGVFIGNTAENIINGLHCPVLAVKPAGFVRPLSATRAQAR